MNARTLRIRRTLTLVGSLGAVLLGLAAIQAAAAWTAQAAPLAVTPVSATSIESKLLAEQARSADLQAQLDALAANADGLSTALSAARARIDADAAHAKALERDLHAARKKLTALQRSIRVATLATATRATITTAPARTSGGDDDAEGGDD